MIANPSFEIQRIGFLDGGAAEGWPATTQGSAEETAEFAADLGFSATGSEAFEHGWGSLNPQHIISSLGVVDSLPAETMTGWLILDEFPWLVGNAQFMELGATEAAAFNTSTSTTETFSVWVTELDTDQVFSPSELSAALFGATPYEPFEDRVEPETLSSVAAAFDAQPAEVFYVRAPQAMYANVTFNRLVRVDNQPFNGTNNDLFVLITAGKAPAPLTSGSTYAIIARNDEAVSLGAYPNAPEFVLEDEGTGVQYLYSDPAKFWQTELS